MSVTMRPIVRVARSRVSSRAPPPPDRTRLTVAVETFARLATSVIVAVMGSVRSARDLVEAHRPVLVERSSGRLCDPQRLDAVPRHARARQLAGSDPDECHEFGRIGLIEAV